MDTQLCKLKLWVCVLHSHGQAVCRIEEMRKYRSAKRLIECTHNKTSTAMPAAAAPAFNITDASTAVDATAPPEDVELSYACVMACVIKLIQLDGEPARPRSLEAMLASTSAGSTSLVLPTLIYSVSSDESGLLGDVTARLENAEVVVDAYPQVTLARAVECRHDEDVQFFQGQGHDCRNGLGRLKPSEVGIDGLCELDGLSPGGQRLLLVEEATCGAKNALVLGRRLPH